MQSNTVGIIGTGDIAEALVTGWRGDLDGPAQLVLSPRNAEVSHRLAATHAGVTVARDNQAVLDQADIVVLCVRPQVAEGVLAALRFADRHRVVSLIATVDLDRLASWIAPAHQIVRAVPMPFAAKRRGPIALFPPTVWARDLLAPLGDVIEAATAEAYDRFCGVTATMSAYFRWLGTIGAWLVAGGVPPDLAARYVASQFEALSQEPAEPIDFAAMTHDYATQGGINEQLRQDLETAGVFAQMTDALDRVLDRIQGRGSLPD
jgi:pyrroline-5-carboxylate reductase